MMTAIMEWWAGIPEGWQVFIYFYLFFLISNLLLGTHWVRRVGKLTIQDLGLFLLFGVGLFPIGFGMLAIEWWDNISDKVIWKKSSTE